MFSCRLLSTDILGPCIGRLCSNISRASEQLRVLEQLQLHLHLADLLGSFSPFLVLNFLASGALLAVALRQRLLPLAHLDRMEGVNGGNLLDRRCGQCTFPWWPWP